VLAAAASAGSPTWTDIQTPPEVSGVATYILNLEWSERLTTPIVDYVYNI
jgi:hypothetical protein